MSHSWFRAVALSLALTGVSVAAVAGQLIIRRSTGDAVAGDGGGTLPEGPGPGGGTPDITAPGFLDLSVQPSEIGQGDLDRTITLTIRATDPEGFAGGTVGNGTVEIGAGGTLSSGALAQTGGTSTAPEFTYSFDIPVGQPVGSYPITLTLIDAAGNSTAITSADLIAQNLAGAVSVSGGTDSEVPTIVSVTRSPQSVDVSSGPATVTIEVRARDNRSGISQMNTFIYPPGGGQPFYPTSNQRISGNELDGIWRSTFTIPANAHPGEWPLRVWPIDNVSNSQQFDTHPGNPQDQIDLIGRFDVSASPGDTQPPQITGATVSQRAIDVSTASATVTFDIDVTDDVTGVRSDSFSVIMNNPDGSSNFSLQGQATLSSGTSTNGTFSTAITFPQFLAAGTYTVTAWLIDGSNNQQIYNGQSLAALGTITVSSISDSQPPQVVSATPSPATVTGTATADQTVTYTVRITDDLSGVDPANMFLRLATPASWPIGFTVPLTLVSGDAMDGTYQATVTIPQATPGPSLQVDIQMSDQAGNGGLFFEGDFPVLADLPVVP